MHQSEAIRYTRKQQLFSRLKATCRTRHYACTKPFDHMLQAQKTSLHHLTVLFSKPHNPKPCHAHTAVVAAAVLMPWCIYTVAQTTQ
jgi:hypothetical protein